MDRVASISELKARLSAYLTQVRQGVEVVVTDRGVPIARIVPLSRGPGPAPERLTTLVRAGVLREPRAAAAAPDLLQPSAAQDPTGQNLAALLDERARGR